jgi:hypothetical protein
MHLCPPACCCGKYQLVFSAVNGIVFSARPDITSALD